MVQQVFTLVQRLCCLLEQLSDQFNRKRLCRHIFPFSTAYTTLLQRIQVPAVIYDERIIEFLSISSRYRSQEQRFLSWRDAHHIFCDCRILLVWTSRVSKGSTGPF